MISGDIPDCVGLTVFAPPGCAITKLLTRAHMVIEGTVLHKYIVMSS